MKKILFILPVTIFMILLMAGIPRKKQGSAVHLSVDTTIAYQVIEGFGAFNTLSFWKEDYGRKIDFLANDMGLSIFRFELPPTFQPVKGGPYDKKGKVFGGPDLEHNFTDARELAKSGVKKFIASIWSPPAWMKTLNSEGKGPTAEKGGSLRPDAYEDFARYCAGYCKAFRSETGVDLYAMGLQNEPEFVEPYNSCVYNPEQMKEALRAVGREFLKEGITTKIYIPEALPEQKHVAQFFDSVNEDEETSRYANIFAIHNYDADGMNVGGATAMEWKQFSEISRNSRPPKQLWMTETSGHANTWEGAMLLAANIYNALAYGNLNAWLWWAIADQKSSEVYALIIDGKPTGRYYASKHYYKFIRPGAVRIKSETGDPEVLALAFKNSGENRLVAVLINRSREAKDIDLKGIESSSAPDAFVSNENRYWVKARIGEFNQVSLPPVSMMTLVWK